MRQLSPIALSALLACSPAPGTTADPTSGATTDTGDPSTTSGIAFPTTDISPDVSTAAAGTTHGSSTASTFIADPDGGLPGLQCDPYQQNCPEGEKCTPWAPDGSAWNSTKCVPITGDAAPGENCTYWGDSTHFDDCAAGSLCWGHLCIALCTGTPAEPICPPGYDCFQYGDDALNLCLPECDPLLQDCPAGEKCVPLDESFTCILTSAETKAQIDDPCYFSVDCDIGLACLAPATTSAACNQRSPGCCTPFCQLPDAPCPDADQQCLPWYDPMQPIPPGYESLGFCGIPE